MAKFEDVHRLDFQQARNLKIGQHWHLVLREPIEAPKMEPGGGLTLGHPETATYVSYIYASDQKLYPANKIDRDLIYGWIKRHADTDPALFMVPKWPS